MAGSRLGIRHRRSLAVATALVMSLAFAAGARAAPPGWLGQEQVDPHNSALNAVSCATASYCVTGGLDLIVQDHAVRSDLSAKLSPDTDEVAAISCAPGTTFCALADDSGGVYTMSAGTLSARTAVDAPNGFDSVSCPTTTFCMAIDELGKTYKYTGSSWVGAGTVGSVSTGVSSLQMSCVSQQFCITAVPSLASDEPAYQYNGINWVGAAALQSSGASATGLSCTSSTFCVAADSSDHTERFSGSAWTDEGRHGSGNSTNDQFYVSCAQQFCLADSFEDGSTYLTTDGSTWSPGSSLKDSDTGNGAGGPTSCTSSTMCVVVDLSGVGNTYGLPDTLATQPSLVGSATVGGTIKLTPGTVANPDTSVVDDFQRCLGGCTTLTGTSYTTTAADEGANLQDMETTGVGLDTQGPFKSNAIGPIAAATVDSGGSGGGGNSHPVPAVIGTVKVSGTSVHVTVSCPATSSTSCTVKVALVITEKLSGKKVVAITARKKGFTYRKVTLGTSSVTLKRGAHKQLVVSLDAAGKELLASRHTLKVGMSVTRKGASTITRQATFKAPRKKKRK
jgi:hypothetical protein